MDETEWKWIDNSLISEQRLPGMNYRIEDGDNPNSNLYVVYCSSNGIYFPNNEETFRKRIIEQDKYDWKRNRIKKNVCKHIYIRDLYKNWYVEGINIEINTIQKVADWIVSITPKGAEFVFIGSSAGGYMSICLASILGGTVFAGSPQIQLKVLDKYPFLCIHQHDRECNRWFDLKQVISESKCKSRYYILYGAKNEEDHDQISKISDLPNVKVIEFDTDLHGVVFLPFNVKDFYRKADVLERMSMKNKMVSRITFSVKVSGLWRTLFECGKKIIKR